MRKERTRVGPVSSFHSYCHRNRTDRRIRLRIASLDKLQELTASIFISTVYAQDRTESNGNMISIRKEDVKPSFSIPLLRAMGRNVSANNYTFVVGTAKSEEEALRATERLNLALSCKKPDANSLCARIIQAVQPEGKSRLFIMVGGFSSKQEVESYRTKAIKDVLSKARTTNDPPTIESAYNLSEGKILKGEALFSD